MKVIRSNFPLMFEKRFVLIVLNPFFFVIFIASEFISAARIFFLFRYLDAVSERIPVPVPISK